LPPDFLQSIIKGFDLQHIAINTRMGKDKIQLVRDSTGQAQLQSTTMSSLQKRNDVDYQNHGT